MMKANNQLGFININEDSIDEIIKDGEVIFEKGFLREKTSTTLPITFGGVGKDLKDYRIYGNTYQNSTIGQQLFNVNDNPVFTGSTETITIENNYITCAYNNTGTSQKELQIYTNNLNLQPSTTYLCVAEIIEVSGTGTFRPITRWAAQNQGQFNYDEAGFLFSDLIAGQKILFPATTYSNLEEKIRGLRTIFLFQPGESGSIKVRISILEDTTITIDNFSYEPYTGGQPSPNPDYPQEIISCGDRTKNLCFTNFNNWESGQYEPNGNKGGIASRIRLKELLPVEPSVTYYFDTFDTTETTLTHTFFIRECDANGSFINNVGTVNNQSTITTGNTTHYLMVTIGSSSAQTGENFESFQNYFEQGKIKPFICLNSETDKSYEPYGYKIPVNVRSDNIFSNNVIENGYVLEETGIITTNSNYYICKETNIKSLNKYILSENQNYTVSAFTPVRVCAYDKNDNFISLLLSNRRTEVKRYTDEFVIPANTDYILIGFRNTDTNIELIESIDTNIYLDEPLRKIDGYSDIIDFKNGKVIRNIDEIVLDGSETWNIVATYTNTLRFQNTTALNGGLAITDKKIMSNLFIVSGPTDNSDYEHIRNAVKDYPEYIFIFINKNRLDDNTVAAFKTWLQSNNVTVDYVLETPTEEDIELPNIPTIDGNNTLNIETEITPSQVFIKYKSNE